MILSDFQRGLIAGVCLMGVWMLIWEALVRKYRR